MAAVNRIHIILMIEESEAMVGDQFAVIRGINEFIRKLRGKPVILSIVFFSVGARIRYNWQYNLPQLRLEFIDYRPHETPIEWVKFNDNVSFIIDYYIHRYPNIPTIMYIIGNTADMDRRSRRNKLALERQMAEVQERYDWQFVYCDTNLVNLDVQGLRIPWVQYDRNDPDELEVLLSNLTNIRISEESDVDSLINRLSDVRME